MKSQFGVVISRYGSSLNQMGDCDISSLFPLQPDDFRGIDTATRILICQLRVGDDGEPSEDAPYQLQDFFSSCQSLEELNVNRTTEPKPFLVRDISDIATDRRITAELSAFSLRVSAAYQRPIELQDIKERITWDNLLRRAIFKRVKSLQRHMITDAFFRAFDREITIRKLHHVVVSEIISSRLVSIRDGKVVKLSAPDPSIENGRFLLDYLMESTDYGRLLRSCKFEAASKILTGRLHCLFRGSEAPEPPQLPMLVQIRELREAVERELDAVVLSNILYTNFWYGFWDTSVEGRLFSMLKLVDFTLLPLLTSKISNWLERRAGNLEGQIYPIPPDRIPVLVPIFVDQSLALDPDNIRQNEGICRLLYSDPEVCQVLEDIELYVKVDTVCCYTYNIRHALRHSDIEEGIEWWVPAASELGDLLQRRKYGEIALKSCEPRNKTVSWIENSRNQPMMSYNMEVGKLHIMTAVQTIDSGLFRGDNRPRYSSSESMLVRQGFQIIMQQIKSSNISIEESYNILNFARIVPPLQIFDTFRPEMEELKQKIDRKICHLISLKLYFHFVHRREGMEVLDQWWRNRIETAEDSIHPYLEPLFSTMRTGSDELYHLEFAKFHRLINNDSFKIHIRAQNSDAILVSTQQMIAREVSRKQVQRWH